MKSGPTYKLAFRRRREEKTNYKKRLAAVKGNQPRFVIRKSLSHIRVGIMEYFPTGDTTRSMTKSSELRKYGWKLHGGNLSAAYLTGYLAGKKARQQNVGKGVADIGLITPVHGSAVFACIKGIKDSGIEISCDERAFPKEERIRGKHVEAYAKNQAGQVSKNQFSAYRKQGIDPATVSGHVNEVLSKIKEMK